MGGPYRALLSKFITDEMQFDDSCKQVQRESDTINHQNCTRIDSAVHTEGYCCELMRHKKKKQKRSNITGCIAEPWYTPSKTPVLSTAETGL